MLIQYKLAYFKDFKSNDRLTKTINYLKVGDFKSAQTKKLTNTNYFRAKINYEDRVLFTFIRYQNTTYILLLETILNHEYDKSKFLRGVKFEEEDIDFKSIEPINSIYVNEKKEFRYIDKFISFSQEQESTLSMNPPLLLIGSAGSGKTSVAIEKLKELKGKVLYTSLSAYLVKNSQQLCKDSSNIDFLTFDNCLNKRKKQSSLAVDFHQFKIWAKRHKIKEIALYFEEFKGVITGIHTKAYLTREEYMALGIKQSLFDKNSRVLVYQKFEKYLIFLKDKNLYDSNILASSLLEKVEREYDYIVIDEIQDFTNIEIFMILKSLKNPKNFIFSGDANQIIYSNFFSWSNLKSMLFHETDSTKIKILTQNYRSSKAVTHISNQLLKIKQLRFGSIDKESNYLIDNASLKEGTVSYHKANDKLYKEFNKQINNSVNFAIIVFDEEAKKRAKEKFSTPLIFSILEAKGLEYENVILLNFIDDNQDKFYEISSSIGKESLQKNKLEYSRTKDKSNHELEKYKIYINALYVAFTRTIENLYIVEQKKHSILELLNIVESQYSNLKVKKSSKEEWIQEAERLKEMGKEEQAEGILNRVSKEKIKKVPNNQTLKDRVLRGDGSKEEIEKVFEQARKDFDFETIEYLVNELNFKEAKEYLYVIDNIPCDIIDIKDPLLEAVIIRKRDLKSIDVGKIISELFMTFEERLFFLDKKHHKAELEKFLKENRDNIKSIELLLKNSAKVRKKISFFYFIKAKKGFCGTPPLFDACRHGLLNLSRLLIERGVDIDEKERFGATALLGAIDSQYSGERGFVSIVKLLLENGANPNIAGYFEKNTPLISASQFGMIEIVKLLLEYGVDPNISNKNGFTPLLMAILRKDKKMIKLLKKYGAEEEVDIPIDKKESDFKNTILNLFDKFKR